MIKFLKTINKEIEMIIKKLIKEVLNERNLFW